jgi:predicted AAA+ superfamily ATPase
MNHVPRRLRRRYRKMLLKRLNRLVASSTTRPVSIASLASELGWATDLARDIIGYWTEKNCIKFVGG